MKCSFSGPFHEIVIFDDPPKVHKDFGFLNSVQGSLVEWKWFHQKLAITRFNVSERNSCREFGNTVGQESRRRLFRFADGAVNLRFDLIGWRGSVKKQFKVNCRNRVGGPRQFFWFDDSYSRSFFIDDKINAFFGGTCALFENVSLLRHFGYLLMHRSQLSRSQSNLPSHIVSLSANGAQGMPQKQNLEESDYDQQQTKDPDAPVCPIPCYRHGGNFGDRYGMLCIVGGLLVAITLGWPVAICFERGWRVCGWLLISLAFSLGIGGCLSGIIGCLPWDWWRCLHDGQEHSQRHIFHNRKSVTQKYLTTLYCCNTVIDMANVLSTNKQTAIISALAEGSSIRSIERITGVHRDTIMRLGVKIGKGCEMLLDSKMQDLGCRYLQFDEVWGFIGKKERHVRVDDDPEFGDVWTFCAIDSETKLVPSFLCGKRNHVTANEFVKDVASRMRNQVQISTDALHTYVEAVEHAFGTEVDYGQIVKVYTHDAAQHPERKYSAPQFASAMRRPIVGNPDMELVSTSHVERLNATTRLHVKRLSRLTLAFSKKFDNFKAAVALHFAYYNLVKRHNTLRCTPAMAAGVERDFWTVEQLVEAVS